MQNNSRKQNRSNTHSHSSHSHNHSGNKRALLASFILIASFMVVEFIGGFLTNSLALISDAGHMLSDAVALGLSLGALILGTRPATPSKTYGYKRFEILAALLNGVALVVIAIFICKEAIERLSAPPPVIGKEMMIIATIGLIINLVVIWILYSQGSTKENLNIRSAFLHVIGDLLGSVGAITAAVLILVFNWYVADPIASMLVSLLILYSGWNVIKESVHVLMESKPVGIDYHEVIKILESLEGVSEAHDLHIWMMTPEYYLMTVHLKVNPDTDRDLILEKAKAAIAEEFGISHVTIQTEGRELCLPDNACY